MSMTIKSKTEDSVKCDIVDGGELKSRRLLNVREKSATLSSITKKDWDDITFEVDNKVYFYVASFVKDAEFVHELKNYLKSCGVDIHVIVKIESANSIPNLHSIITASGGTMVVRGDLSVELPIEEVPLLQEEIINLCRNIGKAIIVATNMLGSMIVHPTPTRTKVSNITTVVREGSDGIMLSGETTHGKFLLKVVQVMHTVALQTKATILGGKIPPNIGQVLKNYMSEMFAYHATMMSITLGTSIIVSIGTGTYRQPLYVAKTKNFITLVGLRPEDTVLTWNNTATSIHHHQDARVIGTGTFGCGTIIVEGGDFIAENITFENSSPQGAGQAVAVRVTVDRCAFYNCRFLGWQDTLYLHYGIQYLKDCYIEGSVDFIFGNSTALLEHCHIHCKSAGFITAQSRNSPQEKTGYVFLRCVVTGNGGTSYAYLGRPWRPFARVVFAFTYMDQCIKPAGWNNWGKIENEKTACFYEYRCFGPGWCPSQRVKWARELQAEAAEQFLMHSFIDPESERPWLAQRMALKIPYSA
ncbi:Pectinesterase 31 [Glycine soja]|nr:Pectinesterase 31 [Glycine soja]